MKNIVKVLALVSLLGVLAVACQKETDNGPLPAVVTRTVDFRIDNGALQRSVLHGDVQWHNFLAAVFDSVDRGYRVSLLHEGNAAAKETVTHTTADRKEAIRLADSLYNANYDVTLWYDSDAGHYVITGQKSTAPGPQSLARRWTEHPFWPFDEYLPGTWRQLHDFSCVIVSQDGYCVYRDWGEVVRDSQRTGIYEFPTYNQAMSLILYGPQPTLNCRLVWDSDGNVIDTIWSERTVRFTADSVYILFIDEFEHQLHYTDPYYIIGGDSLQVYRVPGYPANCYSEECRFNGLPIDIIEWTEDTVLLKADGHTDCHFYSAFVREPVEKK